MVALRDEPRLGDALDRLAGALENLDVGPGLPELDAERERLAGTIRSYLIPRTEGRAGPMTVVFAGPTGSGKSTIVNSLTGLDLSRAGVLRPTTSAPVVLTARGWSADFASIGGIECELVVGTSPVLETMVLVDTPDVDSTELLHRAMTERLIDNADVVIFVTSALRYADATPWQVLRRAVSRGAEVVPVLNRVSPDTGGAVVDLRSMMRDAGLDDELVTIPEHHLARGAQKVPALSVRSLRRRLAAVVAGREHQDGAIFERVLQNLVRQVADFNDSLTDRALEGESAAAAISSGLAERALALDLADTTHDLHRRAPNRDDWQALRRWLWRNRRRPRLSSDEVAAIQTRIEMAVERDLRLWMVDELPGAGVEAGSLMVAVQPILHLALNGWIDFVQGIARDEGGWRSGLAEVVLVSAATDPDAVADAVLLFPTDGEELAARAGRDLRDRLEVVYQQLGSGVIERARRQLGEIDVSDLRTALDALTSMLAVHA